MLPIAESRPRCVIKRHCVHADPRRIFWSAVYVAGRPLAVIKACIIALHECLQRDIGSGAEGVLRRRHFRAVTRPLPNSSNTSFRRHQKRDVAISMTWILVRAEPEQAPRRCGETRIGADQRPSAC